MADHFYSVNKGTGFDPSIVTVGVATSGQSIELRLHDGDGLTRMDVLRAIETLESRFQENEPVTP
jgi:hypothetical protein